MEIQIDIATAQQQASMAGFDNVQDYVADLLQRDAERQSIRQALDESSADIAAGRTRPYGEAIADIRAKHELS
jgi:phosphoglucomutase